MATCTKCVNGVIDTGNNELPCDCSLGDTAQFNVAGVVGQVTGAEVKRHFQNNSPEPITLGAKDIPASSLPRRQ